MYSPWKNWVWLAKKLNNRIQSYERRMHSQANNFTIKILANPEKTYSTLMISEVCLTTN